MSNYSKKIKQFIQDEFEKWIKETNTIRHKIDLAKTKKVFNAYFNGLEPFPTVKSRKDIPDAFIYETVKELNTSTENLYFICEDGNLKKSISKLGNIEVFSSLEKFIESNIYQILLKEDIISEKFDLIKSKIPKHNNVLEKYIEKNIEYEMQGETFTDNDIPDDNNDATIEGIYEANNIVFNYSLAKYYGEGIIVIPFELKAEALVDYYLFKSDYYTMNQDRAHQLSISDHNDHYFWVEEDLPLIVSGKISIQLNIKSLENEDVDLFDYDLITFDAIEEIAVAAST
jgi:hypothetical protein